MPSPTSGNEFRTLATKLDVEDWRGLERSISTSEAELVLALLAGRDTLCPKAEAVEFADQLTGFYPAREVNNPKAYVAGMAALLASYPRDFVKRVCSPVDGLPTRLKWLPTLADVREALDGEKARRERIAAHARYVIRAHEEAKAKAESDAEFERNRPAAEERARRAQEIIRNTRAALDPKQFEPTWGKPPPASDAAA